MKRRMIDAHVHGVALRPLDEAMARFTQAGVQRMGLLSFAQVQKKEQTSRIGHTNPEVLAAKTRYPDRLFAFGAPCHLPALSQTEAEFGAELVRQARALRDTGFDGVKFLETKPSFHVTFPYPLEHQVFEGFFRELETRRLPILWHVADPVRFWNPAAASDATKQRGWYYGEGNYPSKEYLHRISLDIVQRHPGLPVIFAHFFFLSNELKRLGDILDSNTNVNVDITPGTEMYRHFTADVEQTRAFFIRYQDRILLGTDTYIEGDTFDGVFLVQRMELIRRSLETGEAFEDPCNRNVMLRGLSLPEPVLEKIYGGNYERIVGAAPGPLNREKALEECDRLVAQLGGADPMLAEARRIIEAGNPASP